MKRVLLRADDLGYSEGVNLGIEKCVRKGTISNVGVMVNMNGVQHGLRLLKAYDVCLGLHTNICAGKSLCDPKKISSLVDADGTFKNSREYRNAKEDFVIYEEAVLEIEAQLRRFEELTGQKPGYFEAHAVSSTQFFRALEDVAARYELTYNPMPKDFSKPITVGKSQMLMFPGSFGEKTPQECFVNAIQEITDEAVHAIVYHPGYVDAELMRGSSLTLPRIWETEFLCGDVIEKTLVQQQLASVKYSDL